ncbi:hypothetical protein Nepgr_023581 [Nepenthes gracilis]|uniref:HMA domain-containing protein n=1 Tax=Nepenthes gracilis TaxID=150966 RepID=A0AAD3T3B9_NEPGR|nr:hypothetical protein Nepgr_023581 [Nepenthes gracilis]
MDSRNSSTFTFLTDKDQNKTPVLVLVQTLQELNNSDLAALVVDHKSYAVSNSEEKHTLMATDDFVQPDAILGSKKIEASVLFRVTDVSGSVQLLLEMNSSIVKDDIVSVGPEGSVVPNDLAIIVLLEEIGTTELCKESFQRGIYTMEMDVMKENMHSLLQSPGQLPGLSTVLKDEDIKNAIEDAGFDAEILFESSIPQKRAGGTLLGQFTIGGMTSAACVNSVEGILEALLGVKCAVVSLATSLGEVEYDPANICKDDIVNAVEDTGFEGSLVKSCEQDKIIVEVAGISGEMDVDFLEGLLSHINGIMQFYLDRKSRELEVLFDLEVIGCRSLVDSIEEASGGRLKLHGSSLIQE